MFKITYKRNGDEFTKEFENREDLIEEVVLKDIKDEELVSVNFNDTEISGGVNGLALYALRYVDEIREAKKAAEELKAEYQEEDGEEFEEDEYAEDEYEEDETLGDCFDNMDELVNDFIGNTEETEQESCDPRYPLERLYRVIRVHKTYCYNCSDPVITIEVENDCGNYFNYRIYFDDKYKIIKKGHLFQTLANAHNLGKLIEVLGDKIETHDIIYLDNLYLD